MGADGQTFGKKTPTPSSSSSPCIRAATAGSSLAWRCWHTPVITNLFTPNPIYGTRTYCDVFRRSPNKAIITGILETSLQQTTTKLIGGSCIGGRMPSRSGSIYFGALPEQCSMRYIREKRQTRTLLYWVYVLACSDIVARR